MGRAMTTKILISLLLYSQNAAMVDVGVAASRRPANDAAPARGAKALTPPRPRRVSCIADQTNGRTGGEVWQQ